LYLFSHYESLAEFRTPVLAKTHLLECGQKEHFIQGKTDIYKQKHLSMTSVFVSCESRAIGKF